MTKLRKPRKVTPEVRRFIIELFFTLENNSYLNIKKELDKRDIHISPESVQRAIIRDYKDRQLLKEIDIEKELKKTSIIMKIYAILQKKESDLNKTNLLYNYFKSLKNES